jgi:hypothetical protein
MLDWCLSELLKETDIQIPLEMQLLFQLVDKCYFVRYNSNFKLNFGEEL